MNARQTVTAHYDTVIIGGGAAGVFCAIEAGRRGRRVLLLEKSKAVGEKIRISGGGRCNFTNIHTSPANYLSNNPHFCVSALKRYTPSDFIALIERHKIAYHEKTLGQLFCDGSAKQIIAMLLAECEAAGVTIMLNSDVAEVSRLDDGFKVELVNESAFTTSSLVIATGGPSIPKMGATGWGYEIARQFGLNIIPPRAALVPFTLEEGILEKLKPLSGVSLEVIATCNQQHFREGMLFTHRGLSGPAILQISSYWNDGDALILNLAPDTDLLETLKAFRQTNPKQTMEKALAQMLPKRLANYICNEYGHQKPLAEHSNQMLQEVADLVCAWKVIPNGTEGYRTAEVTLGGVDTDELSSKTFEAKKVPGLYFIGEVVDVTGHLGGFNFQWAWSSGHAAGQYV